MNTSFQTPEYDGSVPFAKLPDGQSEPYAYDCIPKIKRVLPKHRGWPGYQYMYCTVFNRKRAQNEGWIPAHGDAAVFTIIGPLGSVDCHLLCRGTSIKGQSPDSGARMLWVDYLISKYTGHPLPILHSDGESYQWSEGDDGDAPVTQTKEAIEPLPQKRGPGRPRKNEGVASAAQS